MLSSVKNLFLLLHSHMIREQVTAVLDPESEHDGRKANRDRGIKHHAEGMRIRLLERHARSRHDRRGHPGHTLKRARHTDRVLNDRRDQRAQIVRAVSRADGRRGEVIAQVLVHHRRQNGREDRVADRAARAAERAQQARAQAQLLHGDEQARGHVRQGGHPGEAALAKQLHGAPGHFVVGHDGGVGARKRALHAQGHNDLVADMFNLVHETW